MNKFRTSKVTIFFGFTIFLLTLTFALSCLTCKHVPTKQEKPYTFSVVSGNFPPGLTLSSNGVISGTPTTEGTYTFSIKITDSSNPANEAIKEFTLTVKEKVLNPDVKVNGSDGPITLNESDTITVTVTLDNNNRTDHADWWIAEDTPFGLWFFTFEDWTDNWQPAYQGPLFYLEPYDLFSPSVSGPPEGTYTFYFAVDTNMNGNITWDSLYFDTVEVNVTE